jgi:hypothetical protein
MNTPPPRKEESARTVTANGLAWTEEAARWCLPDPREVTVCKAFITWFGKPRKTINGSVSSYGLKHAAERWSGSRGGIPYVSNGAFIVAAREMNIPMKPCRPGSLNVYFALGWKRETRWTW